jgi:hypothetical protein
MAWYAMIAVMALAADPSEPTFPLRTATPPREWQKDEINKGLPYRWERGSVNVLAWETTEEVGKDERWTSTQILVLKRFDEPTAKGGHRWVLAHLFHLPKDKDWPWRNEMLHIPPVPVGQPFPMHSNAMLFGFEFFNEIPTDKQIAIFLEETDWKPRMGVQEAFTVDNDKVVTLESTNTLVAGGVDRALWKEVFGRDVPTNLFTELQRPATESK